MKLFISTNRNVLFGLFAAISTAGMVQTTLAADAKPSTAARRLSALRQYYKFVVGEGWRSDDPTAALDSPKLGRPLPKLLDEDEVARSPPGRGGEDTDILMIAHQDKEGAGIQNARTPLR